MKLSEAILKGCKIAPRQVIHQYTSTRGCACVLGAAALGAGLREPGGYWDDGHLALMKHFGVSMTALRQAENENFDGIPREQIAASLAEAGL